ncbi:MAG: thioredoxin [Gemmatimonadetes bacterium]|nr:thioredoxin [Gemmatimonadota bacterium]
MTATAAQKTRITIRCPSCQAWNRIDAARVANGPKCGKCHNPLSLDHPVPLDDDTFSRTIAESEVPVLVDFYADWCGPCKMMAPFVDQLARERQGTALIAKLDTDHAQRTAAGFNIRGIPTTIIFKNGKEAVRRVGAVHKKDLELMLDGV